MIRMGKKYLLNNRVNVLGSTLQVECFLACLVVNITRLGGGGQVSVKSNGRLNNTQVGT